MKCKKCSLNIRADCMLTTGVCVFCHYGIRSWDSNGQKVTKKEAIGRNPKRIKRILRKLEKVWLRYDDWRLCQLLSNILREEAKSNDLFYVEDNILEQILSYNINKE